jgi:hypothetical protein
MFDGEDGCVEALDGNAAECGSVDGGTGTY